MTDKSPNAKLTVTQVRAWMSDTDKRLLENADTMRFVIYVLLGILGTSVITTGLWVIDSFNSKNKPQVIYNITTTNEKLEQQTGLPKVTPEGP